VPDHPTPLAASAGTAELVDIVNLVAQAIFADLRRSGQSIEPTQWATLRLIASGPWTMTELARHKAVTLPTMSKSVGMLERRGWVERVVDDADRRQTLVRLTDAGRDVLVECRRQAEESVEQRLATLGAADRDRLTASLRHLREVLRSTSGS
jgi:DNA-binding MarR family transcriptional regulator